MKKLKYTLLFVSVSLVVLACFIHFNNSVETWVAKQAIKYYSDGQQRIKINSLDYIYPNKIEIKQLDLSNKGMVKHFSAATALLEISSLNTRNIKFKNISIASPNITLSETPKKKEDTTKHNKKTSSTDVAFLISIKKLGISNGTLKYIATDKENSLSIANINGTLTNESAASISNAVYRSKLSAKNKEGVNIDAEGTVNLKENIVQINNSHIHFDFSNKHIFDALPKYIKTFHEVFRPKEALSLKLTGDININNFASSSLASQIDSSAILVKAGKLDVHFEKCSGEIKLQKFIIQSNELTCHLGEGKAKVHQASVDLNEKERTYRLFWDIKGLNFKNLFPNEDKLRGTLSSNGNTSGALDTGTIHNGEGEIQIEDGYFSYLPVLTQLSSLLNLKGIISGEFTPDDELEAEFILNPKDINFKRLDIENNVMATRIKGRIFYDGNLDMRANAGPIEKIGSILGPVGKLANAVTDQIVAYKLNGNIDSPKISPIVLGVGTGK